MVDLILQTRVLPPRRLPNIIHRKRLLENFRENEDKSLVLICGSAGFGKTTLALDFFHNSGHKFAWLHTSEDINEPYLFFSYLIHSLRNLEFDFGKNTLELLEFTRKDEIAGKNIKSALNDLASSLLNDFVSTFKEDVYWVIDDLHNIDNENNTWIPVLFEKLFDMLPWNLHFVITTRTEPSFNLARLRTKRKVFEFHNEELEFNLSEIDTLIDELYPEKKLSGIADIIEKNSNGWITGIHLMLQSRDKISGSGNEHFTRSDENLFHYFAIDIFNDLDENTKKFLHYTSLSDSFSTEMADYLLGWSDSQPTIENLIRRNLFIHVFHSEERAESSVSYKYHDLFLKFLRKNFSSAVSEDEKNKLTARLIDYHIKSNHIISAITICVNSSCYEKADVLLSNHFNSLFDSGYFQFLFDCILKFPEEYINNNPFLNYCLGKLIFYYKSDSTKSLQYLNKALDMTENIAEYLTAEILLTKVKVLFQSPDYEENAAILNRLLKGNTSPLIKARTLLELGNLYYRMGFGQYHNAVKHLNESLVISNEYNFNSEKSEAFRLLGNIYADWGDSVKSLFYYENSIKIEANVYDVFRAITSIIRNFTNIGNYDKAFEYIRNAEELASKYPATLFKRFLLRVKAIFFFEFGDYEQAIILFKELIDIESKAKITLYFAGWYAMTGECYYYLHRYDTALQYYDLAFDYISVNREYLTCILNYYKAKSRFLTGSEDTDIEKAFYEMLNYCNENEQVLDKTLAEYYLTYYFLDINYPEAAAIQLQSCLKTSSEKTFCSFLEQEVLNSRHIFDFALQSKELALYKQFTKSIIENTRHKLSYGWISSEGRNRLEVQIASLTDIKLYTFGRHEIHLRNKYLPEENWLRKKSKIIFTFLLCKPDVILTKDKIIDLFLDDIPVNNMDKVFHNTISTIRTALRTESVSSVKKVKGIKDKPKKKTTDFSPNFILYEDKVLRLNPDYSYYTDSVEFTSGFEKAKHCSKPEEKLIHLKKIYKLYKGEFLPGVYDNWCEDLRNDLTNKFIETCEMLSALSKQTQDYTGQIEYSERLLSLDSLNENAYLYIIEGYAAIGNINSAKDKFARMLKKFDDELGEKPDEKILNKIKNILL